MGKLKKTFEKIKSKYMPAEPMTEAINYLLSNWKEFTAFLEDMALPVSNNESERALRQAVLGRKNYRGSMNIDAADQAATLFSVIESCKKSEIDPADYIKYVIVNNNRGKPSLTPYEWALEKRGPSNNWPEPEAKVINPE